MVESKQKGRQLCIRCGFEGAKRTAAGLFECSKCGSVFTGGAYTPTTQKGRIVQKMVSQREFFPHMKELMGAEEKKEQAAGPKEEKKEKPAKKPKPAPKKKTTVKKKAVKKAGAKKAEKAKDEK